MPWKMTMMMTHLMPPHGHHPHYWHWCHEYQYNVHESPHPRGLSLMTLPPQVCPIQSHNHQYHHHSQECPKHQALLLIAQGHALHRRNTVPSWNWCNTISPLPKQHGHKTPWPPNLMAYAKHWRCLNLRCQNLPVSV